MRLATVFALCLLLASLLPAQLITGSVIHGFGGSQVALLDPALQTTTPLQLLPSGQSTLRFTWGPAFPDSLFVWSSDGFIYRSQIIGGTPVPTLLSQQPLSGTGAVVQLSWSASGQLIAVGTTPAGQVQAIDPSSGVVTTLLSWPFSSSPRCGAIDPVSGDLFIGNDQGLWRVSGFPSPSPSVVLVHPATSSVWSLAFDPLDPRFVVFLEGSSMKRFDKLTAGVATLFSGPPYLDLLRVTESGGLIAVDGRNIYHVTNPGTVPPGGITPILIGNNAMIGCCSLTDTVVVGAVHDPFRLDIQSFANGSASLAYQNVPPGVQEVWLLVSSTTTYPVNAGPWLGLFPDALTLNLIAAQPLPQPGSFLHSLGVPPAVTNFPPGSLSVLGGQTWDFVAAAFGPQGSWWGKTGVARVPWQ